MTSKIIAIRALLLGLAALIGAAPGYAAPERSAFDTLNAVRARGCGGKAGHAVPFVRNGELDRAALELSRGASLRESMVHLQHRLQHATSIVIRNATSEESRRRVLADEFCGDILDASLKLAGVFERSDNVWMVLGSPFEAPSKADAAAMTQRVLALINEARAQKRRCGGKLYQPAGRLKLIKTLNKAALRHARDMAAHSFMGHEGSDGSHAAQRATAAGYAWRTVGENVAAGSPTPEQAVADWLKSPGHCANLMNGDYTDTGIALAVNPTSAAGIYWTQVFAAPR